MILFGLKWLYSGKIVCNQAKVVLFRQSGFIRAKVVVFRQIGCIRAKVVVFGQKLLFSCRSGCIRAKWL